MLKRQNATIQDKPNHKRRKFILELFFAILLAIGCAIIGMSNLLWISNDLYPYTADAMGHMTKVVYISDQIRQGHIPSWFPYWYTGSTATQYYVPLSYYIMVPIYWITNNVMLTYKIFCAGVITLGGVGVWAFCYKKIGRGCGYVGIIVFCLQPILLQSMYQEGVVAQGPIFAIMPWFLLLILSCAEAPTRKNYFGLVLFSTLMVLSHAMHAFMVCVVTLFLLFTFILLKKIRITNYIIASSAIVFSGILTAFWSVVGSTKLENETIPYLLPESADRFTANIHWFLPNDENAVLYFSIIITGFTAISILLYLIFSLLKKHNHNQSYYGLACIILTIITIPFSFGNSLPGFGFLPFASNMVPGRILTFTAVTSAITCAYGIAMLWKIPRLKLLFRMLALVIIGFVSYELNPYQTTYTAVSSDYFDEMANYMDFDSNAFEKGRYQWYGALGSQETFFPVSHKYNISNGWNMEGTPHNQVVYNNHIAFPLKHYDYISKQLAFWNIRYLLLHNEYRDFYEQLQAMDYEKTQYERNGFTLYTSNQPSAYYLKDTRNALVISNGMQGFTINFPYLVQGKSGDLADYTLKELLKYKLIYIIEPQVTTLTQKTSFESKVKTLIDSGVTVMIEPVASKTFELFDVSVKNEFFETSPSVSTTVECPYEIENSILVDNSHLRMVRSLYGLDKVYANFNLNNGAVQNAILGTKKVNNGEVIFIGAHLSQYLDSVYTRNNGIDAVSNTVLENSEIVESIYTTLFSYYNIEKDFLPKAFDSITTQAWDYNGGTFSYDSEVDQEITISITYAPRWSATVDGQALEVGQRENLITLLLPAGAHTVKLHYGITLYGKIGYTITVFGLVVLALLLLLWKFIMSGLEKVRLGLRRYLQFDDTSTDTTIPVPVDTGEEEGMAEIAVTMEEELQEDPIAKQIQAMMEQDILSLNNESNIAFGIIQKTIKENDIMVDIIELEEDSIEVGLEDRQPEFIHENLQESSLLEEKSELRRNDSTNESKNEMKNEMNNEMKNETKNESKNESKNEQYRSELTQLLEQIQKIKKSHT